MTPASSDRLGYLLQQVAHNAFHLLAFGALVTLGSGAAMQLGDHFAPRLGVILGVAIILLAMVVLVPVTALGMLYAAGRQIVLFFRGLPVGMRLRKAPYRFSLQWMFGMLLGTGIWLGLCRGPFWPFALPAGLLLLLVGSTPFRKHAAARAFEYEVAARAPLSHELFCEQYDADRGCSQQVIRAVRRAYAHWFEVSPEKIAAHDNAFEYPGCDDFDLITLVLEVEKSLGVKLPSARQALHEGRLDGTVDSLIRFAAEHV